MRLLLDKLYYASGLLAGVFIVLIMLLILCQIVGRWFGILVPATEDISGFFLAAASFLALAYTFREHGHIRVNILLGQVQPKNQRRIEIFCLLILLLFSSYASWSMCLFVIESYQFNDLTSGYIAMPLWIPQTPMALGMVIFAIAVADCLITTATSPLQRGNHGST